MPNNKFRSIQRAFREWRSLQHRERLKLMVSPTENIMKHRPLYRRLAEWLLTHPGLIREIIRLIRWIAENAQ